jgi:hypothetical protein
VLVWLVARVLGAEPPLPPADGGAPVELQSVSIGRDRDFRRAYGGTPGTFAVAGLHPGTWKLYVRAEGFAPHEDELTLDDRAFQTVDIELQPSTTLRLKLLDAAGKPLSAELSSSSSGACRTSSRRTRR